MLFESLPAFVPLGTGDIAVDQFAQGLRVIAEETKASHVGPGSREVTVA